MWLERGRDEDTQVTSSNRIVMLQQSQICCGCVPGRGTRKCELWGNVRQMLPLQLDLVPSGKSKGRYAVMSNPKVKILSDNSMARSLMHEQTSKINIACMLDTTS